MNRETELHYSQIPHLENPRSKFKRPTRYLTTFNTGDIIPVYLDMDILPGDTIKMDAATVVRMATPLYPVMDNAYLDIMFFFVPNRILWNHWKEFWGENTNAWYEETEYNVPQVKTTNSSTSTKFQSRNLADYMGLPINKEGLYVNALPFRAYVKIWNDWFRDENLQQEVPNYTDDTNRTTNINDTALGGKILKANKFHDYFTSALPAPQKGPEVLLPLGTTAPVYTGETHLASTTPMKFSTAGLQPNTQYGVGLIGNSNTEGTLYYTITEPTAEPTAALRPNNLYTDLRAATASTITQLRQAIAIQKFYEAQARGGSRYIEFLKNIFGVTSPDARLQRSEYLGGKRIPVNMMQVLATTNDPTGGDLNLGSTGAYSNTADSDEYFTKSFTEHGILIGLAIVRTDHTYGQGIEKGWSRRKWYDYYVPQLANISEMPVYTKEIYADGTENDNTVFGYQEPWAEYRYGQTNKVTGAMRTTYPQSLDAWHYADHYTEKPILGKDWIKEPTENVDRTLAVQSWLEDQFIGDFYFDTTYVREMPIYSIPGLETL